MSNAQYVVGNADRTTADPFTVPGDEPGTDDSFMLDEAPAGHSVESYVHIENGWDTNIDVTLRGTHYLDETMASAAADGSAITVSSGTNDFFDVVTGHSFIELNVNPAAAPTSGDLTVTFQAREA